MIKLPIVLFSFLFSTSLIAQQKQIDSLKSILTSKLPDTSRINALNNLAFQLYKTDSISTFNYLQESYTKSKKIGFVNGMIEALIVKSGYFIYKSKGSFAVEFLNEALAYAIKSNHTNYQARIYRELGQAKYSFSKYAEALNDLMQAEKIYANNNNLVELEKVYETIAINNSELGNYEVAVKYLLKSLSIKQELNILEGIASTYNNLGRQFFNLKNYDEAIKYYDKSIAYSKKQGDFRTYGITLVNTANIFITQQNFIEGENRLLQAIESFQKIGFKRGIQTCYNNLGAICLRNEQFQKGIDYLQVALSTANENQNKQGVPLIQHNIGFGYRGLKNYTEAMKWYELAEKTANEFKADVLTFNEIYKYRALLDSTIGNFQSAYMYKTKFQNLYEKILNDKTISTVNELQTKYETQQKENKILLLSKSDSIKNLQIVEQQLAISKNLYQITQQKLALSGAQLQIVEDSLQLSIQTETILQSKLDASIKQEKINTLSKEALQQKLALQEKQIAINQKNTTIGIVAVISAIVLLLGYGFYRKKQLEQKAILAAEQAKQRELLTKAVIDAEEAERKRIASDLHDGIGQLFSAVKMNLNGLLDRVEITKDDDKFLAEKTMALVDESCKEVRVISHEMMPNFLLKSGIASDIRSFIEKIDENTLKINFETKGFKEQLEFNEEVILYRVIQELINNVIKHAQANELNLVLEKNNKQVLVKVADNGKGFNYEAAIAKGGLGLKNMLVRIEYLKGKIEFLANKPSGTLVQINIPLV